MAFLDVPSIENGGELDGFIPKYQSDLPSEGTVVDVVFIGHVPDEDWFVSGTLIGVRMRENTFFYNRYPDNVLYNFVTEDPELAEYAPKNRRALFDDALDKLYKR